MVLTGFSYLHRFAVVGDSATVIGLTRFLVNDFSQIPVLAIITDEPTEEWQKQIVQSVQTLEYDDPPAVKFIADTRLIHEELKKCSPRFHSRQSARKRRR